MKKPIIISLFNQAGGVGKTTLTQNLGYHLSQKEYRVLLVDLDPQASLTSFMGLEPSDLPRTIYDSLVFDESIRQSVISLSIYNQYKNLDLVPANLLLANAEQQLIFASLREYRLKNVLQPSFDNYDYILLDCPPSLGMLSLIGLVASSYVLVPIQTQFKATVGTDSLLSTVHKTQKQINPELEILGFIPTQFSKINKTEQRVLELLYEQLSVIAPIFSPLPRTTAIAEATEYGKPFALTPKSNKAIKSLFDEYTTQIESLTHPVAYV
ncbi:ParA family protein [Crocosphaera sp. Alani8]|uniref:ParA family protein n=1 Tax=Crocosphaera sp. Alani8 TaxID=3038952 RepID=UPI00313AEFA4